MSEDAKVEEQVTGTRRPTFAGADYIVTLLESNGGNEDWGEPTWLRLPWRWPCDRSPAACGRCCTNPCDRPRACRTRRRFESAGAAGLFFRTVCPARTSGHPPLTFDGSIDRSVGIRQRLREIGRSGSRLDNFKSQAPDPNSQPHPTPNQSKFPSPEGEGFGNWSLGMAGMWDLELGI